MVLIVGQVIAWLEQAQHMPDVYLLALQTFADKMYMVQRFRAWHRSILASSENGGGPHQPGSSSRLRVM